MPCLQRDDPTMRRWTVALLYLAALLPLLTGCAGSTATYSAGAPILPGSNVPGLSPPASPPPSATPSVSPVPLPAYQSGVDMLLYSDASYASNLPSLMAELHRDHVNSVGLTFPFYTDGLTANSVHTGSGTPPDAQLRGVLNMLEGSGFSVMLRPLLDESNLHPPSYPTGWRGSIVPTSHQAWFESYNSLILHYALIAQGAGVQVYDVGTELFSLEAYTANWTSLIQGVRAVYRGKITYSVNGNSDYWYGYPSGLIRNLDFLSLDGYWNLNVPNSASAATLAQAWGPFLRKTVAAASGKPVVLSEVGVAPQAGEQDHPWLSPQPGPTDYAFQARYYAAACQAATEASFVGIYWWEVDLGEPGPWDPLGKPAEQAISTCFATASG